MNCRLNFVFLFNRSLPFKNAGIYSVYLQQCYCILAKPVNYTSSFQPKGCNMHLLYHN